VSQGAAPVIDGKYLARHREESIFLLNRYFTEHLVRVSHAFGGDLIAAVVLGVIGHHNTRRFYEEVVAKSNRRYEAVVAERAWELLRPCNALSVSDSTGIPRETVRRKIKWLVQQGFVRRAGRAELYVTAKASALFSGFNVDTMARFSDLLADLRAIERRLATSRK